jgi:hypothetical protein
MKKNKYIQCFSQEMADNLSNLGFEYLYETNGIWYFNDNDVLSKSVKFSNGNNFSDSDIVYTKSLNF